MLTELSKKMVKTIFSSVENNIIMIRIKISVILVKFSQYKLKRSSVFFADELDVRISFVVNDKWRVFILDLSLCFKIRLKKLFEMDILASWLKILNHCTQVILSIVRLLKYENSCFGTFVTNVFTRNIAIIQ